MREPHTLSIDDVVCGLSAFDSIIDARSPSEFAADRLPGAINAPVLSDEERALVGTIYKQQSGFEAKRIGAALVARNIARHLETLFANKPRDWAPLIYCWRGGNRSNSLATVLSKIGWRPLLLEGGYKKFRQRVILDLQRLPSPLRFNVIAGRTGCGKSLILAELAGLGAQVLDLEALACHRGSVLGRHPASAQPGQRQFETLLWSSLRQFDPARPVYVESESRRIGTCHVPEALMTAIRAGFCIKVEAPIDTRVRLLLEHYQHFLEQPALLHESLGYLTSLHGHETIGRWRALLEAADWNRLVRELLEQHYDPAYQRSMARNYARIEEAESVGLHAPGPEALRHAAGELLRIGGT